MWTKKSSCFLWGTGFLEWRVLLVGEHMLRPLSGVEDIFGAGSGGVASLTTGYTLASLPGLRQRAERACC